MLNQLNLNVMHKITIEKKEYVKYIHKMLARSAYIYASIIFS